ARELIELVQPAPWKREPAEAGRVVFWLRDPALLARLATASLKLGNDRVQCAAAKLGRQAALLMRVEAPSRYLAPWCEEEPPGEGQPGRRHRHRPGRRGEARAAGGAADARRGAPALPRSVVRGGAARRRGAVLSRRRRPLRPVGLGASAGGPVDALGQAAPRR